MKKAELIKGNDACKHEWVKRDKKNIVILHRVCVECGKAELHCEDSDIDEITLKKIMKVE